MQIHTNGKVVPAELPVYLNQPEKPDTFVVVEFTDTYRLHLQTVEDANELVKAGLAASALLADRGQPEGHPAENPPGFSRDLSGDLDAIPANLIGGPLPLYTPGIGHCGPGKCTCGASVSADGTVTPAGAS